MRTHLCFIYHWYLGIYKYVLCLHCQIQSSEDTLWRCSQRKHLVVLFGSWFFYDPLRGSRAQGTAACKYVSKPLKASCASYTQRARYACFAPVMQKCKSTGIFSWVPTRNPAAQINRLFCMSPWESRNLILPLSRKEYPRAKYRKKPLQKTGKALGGSRGSRTPDPLLVRQML